MHDKSMAGIEPRLTWRTPKTNKGSQTLPALGKGFTDKFSVLAYQLIMQLPKGFL